MGDGARLILPVTDCGASRNGDTRHDGIIRWYPFAWGRNMRTGERVGIRFEGKRRPPMFTC